MLSRQLLQHIRLLLSILPFIFAIQAHTANAALNEADAVAPVLDSVHLVDGSYNLTAHLPAGSAMPAGGYKTILNGAPLTDVSGQLNRTLNNIDTSLEHCFQVQARWTQFDPILFRSSNKICVNPMSAQSPILDEVIQHAGQYILKGHMPADSGTPAGGYKTILNGAPLHDITMQLNRTLGNLDTSKQQCFQLGTRWTQYTPVQFRNSNEICVAPITANYPILDKVRLSDGEYILEAHMPAGSALPAGGFKTIVNGATLTDVSDEINRSVSGLDTSQKHCFRVQARWTEFSPIRFLGSNEVCHAGNGVTAEKPILRKSDITQQDGRYVVTARMPSGSTVPDGGYRLLVNGEFYGNAQNQLNWTLNDLDSSTQQCFQVEAYWTPPITPSTTSSVEHCIAPKQDNGAILVFSSSFESGVSLSADKTDLSGADSSGYDWQHDLEGLHYVRNYSHNFVDGIEGQHYKVDLVDDPINTGGRVLAMENIQVVGSPHSRPQASLLFNYDKNDPSISINEFSVELDMLFDEGFAYAQTLDDPIGRDNNWFSFFEIWENNGNDTYYDVAGRSRVSAYLEKDAGYNSPLYFRARSEITPRHQFQLQWSEINRDVPVPLGRWFTLRAYFKAGGPDTGRFRMSIIDNGFEQTLFDIYNSTQNSANPTAPFALQAKKNYASRKLIDTLQQHGQSLRIYYDNYQFYEGELQ